MTDLACQVSGIIKSFGPNKVLREVDLDLPAGAVTVLMGANGAGKSTLVKILCGVHAADSGSMTLFGKSFRPDSPADAFQSGVVLLGSLPLSLTLSAMNPLSLAQEKARRN